MRIREISVTCIISDCQYGNRQTTLRAEIEENDSPDAYLASLHAMAERAAREQLEAERKREEAKRKREQEEYEQRMAALRARRATEPELDDDDELPF